MNCAATNLMETRADVPTQNGRADTNEGVMTLGLLGFEKHKHYVLLGSPEEAPFLWLQMVDDPKLAFLVVSPAAALKRYEPDISEDDVKFLNLDNPEDAMLFNIVTVHPEGRATVNLKGPVVVNRRTLVGKQIIPLNAGTFSLQQPIEVARTD